MGGYNTKDASFSFNARNWSDRLLNAAFAQANDGTLCNPSCC